MTEQPVVEFQFGGRLSLDFTWTVRYRAVWPTELLADRHDLCRWLEAVELPAPATASPRALAAARELREAIHRAAKAVIGRSRIDTGDHALLNRCAAQPPPFPQLGRNGTLSIAAPAGKEASAAFSAIARDAIELLAANDGRLRLCDGPQCSLLFYDNSRPGTRRWCNTIRCGNKVNTHAYRERQRDND